MRYASVHVQNRRQEVIYGRLIPKFQSEGAHARMLASISPVRPRVGGAGVKTKRNATMARYVRWVAAAAATGSRRSIAPTALEPPQVLQVVGAKPNSSHS